MALDKEAEGVTAEPELTYIMRIGKEQIEYYLSSTNLDKDSFLRERVTTGENGRISVDVFMEFNKVKDLGISAEDLLVACAASPFLEVDAESRIITRKLPYKKDVRRRKKMVRVSGLPNDATSDSVFAVISSKTAEPENVLLQYSLDASGDRLFIGAANVLYFTEEATDAAVETQIVLDDQHITVEYLEDYERRIKNGKRHQKA